MELLGPLAVGAALASSYFLSSNKKNKKRELISTDYEQIDEIASSVTEETLAEQIDAEEKSLQSDISPKRPSRIPAVIPKELNHGGVQWKTERLCRDVFEQYFGVLFPKLKNFVRNPLSNHFLELDGYNKDLKIAFEYQGEQHYNALPNSFCSTQEKLADQVWRDECKKQACEKVGIRLIVINYKITFVNNDDFRRRKRTQAEVRKEMIKILEQLFPQKR